MPLHLKMFPSIDIPSQGTLALEVCTTGFDARWRNSKEGSVKRSTGATRRSYLYPILAANAIKICTWTGPYLGRHSQITHVMVPRFVGLYIVPVHAPRPVA